MQSMAMTKKSATKTLRRKVFYFYKVYTKPSQQKAKISRLSAFVAKRKKPLQLCPSATLHLPTKNLSLQHDISNWRNWFSGRTFIASFN